MTGNDWFAIGMLVALTLMIIGLHCWFRRWIG